MAKREASFDDYNLDEQKRSRNGPSRNPYSWMARNEEKRARNPYSWLASEASENNAGSWRKLSSPPKRQRGTVVADPSSWADNSAKRAAGVRNPYSWMNFV